MLEGELAKQSIEIKNAEKAQKLALKQALMQEEVKVKQKLRELHKI